MKPMWSHRVVAVLAGMTAPKGSATSVPADQPYPDRIADLFLAIAERSANSEIVASIAAIGDRLQLSRHFDAMILADIDAEYNAIAIAFADAEPQAQVRNLLLGYHERRAREAASYARTLAGHPGRQP